MAVWSTNAPPIGASEPRDRKTVLLLGAGASAASPTQPLPTMQRFFVDGQSTGDVEAFLQSFYPPGVGRKAYNLEELLAYLDIARLRDRAWRFNTRGVNLGKVYEDLITFIQTRLDTDPNIPCPLYAELFRTLKSWDSVFTVNYDLLADRALVQVEGRPVPHTTRPNRVDKLRQLLSGDALAPGLTELERMSGFYLKLHGSLNWIICRSKGCPNSQRVFVDDDWRRGDYAGDYCRGCGEILEPLIVPPLAVKPVDKRGRLVALWRVALTELSLCDRIVVIGLSFAPSDHELRWLVRHALLVRPIGRVERLTGLPEIVAVNPDRDYMGRLAGVTGLAPDKFQRFNSIQEYVDSERERLAGPAASPTIERR